MVQRRYPGAYKISQKIFGIFSQFSVLGNQAVLNQLGAMIISLHLLIQKLTEKDLVNYFIGGYTYNQNSARIVTAQQHIWTL